MAKIQKEETAKFKFNEHGVCINPSQIILSAGKIFSFEITAALNNVGWSAGYRYEVKYAHVFTVGIAGANKFSASPTRSIAISIVAEQMLETFIESTKEHPKIKAASHEFQALRDLIASFEPINNQNNSSNKSTTMAKVINAPAPPEVTNIALTSITPSKSNPRTSFDQTAIKELSESISQFGLLQPITLRPKGEKEKFEIVAGERRFRAAKLLKWDRIPAIVRVMTDDEMLEIQIIENLQREDVSPMDEAHAFKTLLAKETIDWLSTRIHKPKKYILDRMKLNDLVEEAQQFVTLGSLPLGHAVFISKLSFADQKACLDKCMHSRYIGDADEPTMVCDITLDVLKNFITENVMLEFSKAPFPLEDVDLYPEAGSCAACPKRTCNNHLLFNDITEEDKCTDASCFNEKIKLFVDQQKAINTEKYGKVLAGEKPAYGSGKIKVQGVEVPIQKQPTKNSIPVVITKVDRWGSKADLGTTFYIDKNKIEQVKKENEVAKKDKVSRNSNGESYEERKVRLLKEGWSRIEFMAIPKVPNTQICQTFLLELIEEEMRYIETFALFGLLKIIPDVIDAETAHQKQQYFDDLDAVAQHNFIETIGKAWIESYSTDSIIQILTLLSRFDDTDESEIDHEEYFGYTWNEMVEMLEPKPKAAPKKK